MIKVRDYPFDETIRKQFLQKPQRTENKYDRRQHRPNACKSAITTRFPIGALRFDPDPCHNLARPALRACLSLASKGYARSERHPQGSVLIMSSVSAALATIPAQTDAVPVKERRIPKRIAEVVRLIVSGECATQKAAAERVGMNYTHVCEMLKKPHVRVFIERAARETIANGTMRASARLVELLDAGSEHVSLDASKHMLAIAGIKPAADAQVSVNIDIKAGYVIDLTDEPKHVRTIDHERP